MVRAGRPVNAPTAIEVMLLERISLAWKRRCIFNVTTNFENAAKMNSQCPQLRQPKECIAWNRRY